MNASSLKRSCLIFLSSVFFSCGYALQEVRTEPATGVGRRVELSITCRGEVMEELIGNCLSIAMPASIEWIERESFFGEGGRQNTRVVLRYHSISATDLARLLELFDGNSVVTVKEL